MTTKSTSFCNSFLELACGIGLTVAQLDKEEWAHQRNLKGPKKVLEKG